MRICNRVRVTMASHSMVIVMFCLVSFTILSAFILKNTTLSAKATEYDNNISVFISSACTMSTGGGSYSESLSPGTTTNIAATTITTACSDPSGYAIYAIGYSGDSYTTNNTDLISSQNSSYNIKTDASGAYGSSWKMKLGSATNVNIATGYDVFHNIPSTYSVVASYASGVSSSTVTPTYQIFISPTQPPGVYTGKVKYTLVHPNNASAPTTS